MRGGADNRRVGARLAAAGVAGCIVLGTALSAGGPPTTLRSWQRAKVPAAPPVEPEPLRLDDSPRLPLLAPFRHAAGRPASHMLLYLSGPFGQWSRRSWQTLLWGGWEAPGTGAPAVVARTHVALGRISRDDADPSQSAWLRRISRPLQGWPVASASRHWFHGGEHDPAPATATLLDETLTSEDGDPFLGSPAGSWASPGASAHLRAFAPLEEVMPPWLTRLDARWAESVLHSAGCGRGGWCSYDTSFPASAFERLWVALAPVHKPIPEWKCSGREVTILRHGRERDSFQLLTCDGAVVPGAVDRLSILARPPETPRPDSLPDEPEPAAAAHGEWVEHIRLVHPRLLWALQQVADAFPWRGIYVFSGYRRPEGESRPGTHKSMHWEGRALDITVQGVPNEELLDLCRKLPDVGCGYYPNNKFLHLDVRPRGFGTAFWIDASAPGEQVRYVDSWPGVVENGAMIWSKVKVQP